MAVIDLKNLQPHKVSRDLIGYIIMLYGEPKTGKTTIATKFPDHLLLAFEKGYNAIPGVMAQPIDSWTDYLQVLNMLKAEEIKNKYKNIIIDTADISYDYCEKYICMRESKEKIGDVPYGAGYSLVEKEFDEKLREIIKLGYGLVIISHAEEKTVKDELGNDVSRTGPTLNKRGSKVVNRMADIIGYIRPITSVDESGKEKSEVFMFTRGTSRYVAGSRFKYMKEYFPLSYNNLVNAIQESIEEEVKQHGSEAVTDVRANLYADDKEEKTFEQVMEEFNKLAESIMNKGEQYKEEINETLKRILGEGRMVRNCTKDQKSLIELINTELQEKLEKL